MRKGETLPEELRRRFLQAIWGFEGQVKAKMVKWPDRYEWCSFAAALGISSVNFFTTGYLTPLAKADPSRSRNWGADGGQERLSPGSEARAVRHLVGRTEMTVSNVWDSPLSRAISDSR